MEEFSIIEFYNLVVEFFCSIIDTGKDIWTLFSTKLSVFIDYITVDWLQDSLRWVIDNLGDYSVLEIGLGAGIGIFILISLIKFLKVI